MGCFSVDLAIILHMLAKTRRIPRKTLEIVLKNGKSTHSPQFSVALLPQKNPEKPSQFAMVVSKKVAKIAVVRNKLRRRGYRAIEQALPDLKAGYFVVIFFKKGTSELDVPTTQQKITEILKKAKLYA
jgi:ribonuclease P protein component